MREQGEAATLQIRARHRRIESDLEREEALHEKYAPLQKY